MKALLVVDVNMAQNNKHICEDDERNCPLWNTDTKFCMYNFNNNTKGCPLKPLPKYKYGFEADGLSPSDQLLIQSGWNDCIDEILGDTE